jgi:cytochrome c peroxidase
MHDGSLATLGVVIDFCDRGAGANPNLDDQIRPLALSREERQALVAFLRALTGSASLKAGTSPRD